MKACLLVEYNDFEIVLKCFISHVTTAETETKVFRPLKEFGNYFRIISATLNMLENIREMQLGSENDMK